MLAMCLVELAGFRWVDWGRMALEYNHEKFKQTVLYVCFKCPPRKLGAAKLHAVLWLSEWKFYLKNEGRKALTGATYLKQQQGHVPWQIFEVIPELVAEGKLNFTTELVLVFQFKLFHVLEQAPAFNLLSTEEKALLDEVIGALKPLGAAEVSELSHRDEAWGSAQLNDEIPYASAWAFLNEEYAGLPSLAAQHWAEEQIENLKAKGQL